MYDWSGMVHVHIPNRAQSCQYWIMSLSREFYFTFIDFFLAIEYIFFIEN